MAQLRMRQLRTPSDFSAQAAGTQESIQRSRMKDMQLRELSASQTARTGEYGSLAEAYGAQEKAAKSARRFEDEQRQIEKGIQINDTIRNAASNLTKSIEGLDGLALQTKLQENYNLLKPNLVRAGVPINSLPPTITLDQLKVLGQQTYTTDQQLKIKLKEMELNNPKPYTLKEGEARYDKEGNLTTPARPKTSAPKAPQKIEAIIAGKVNAGEMSVEQGQDILKKGESKPAPSSERKKITDLIAFSGQLDEINTLYNPSFVGKLDAPKGALSEFMGLGIGKKEITFRQKIKSIQDTILRLKSGAAINESEAARLLEFLPTLTSSDKVFEARLAGLRDEYQKIIAIKQQALMESGYKTVGGAVEISPDVQNLINKYLPQ